MIVKLRPALMRLAVYAAIPSFFAFAVRPVYAESPIVHQIALPSGMSWCSDSTISGILTQINLFRAQNGVAALANSTLGQKDAEIRATQFATYMQTHLPSTPGFNPHEGYDTTAASLGYNIVSENLAFLNTDPVYIVFAIWQDSLHISAMLANSANVAGTSCVYYNGVAYSTYEPGSCTGSSCGSSTTPPSGGTTLDSEESAFLTLVNNYRAANGVGPVQISAGLQTAARWMSNDMVTNNNFSHTDSLGRSTGARLAALGYPYSPWGEDLAAGYSDAQNTLYQWQTACDQDGTGACTYAHRKVLLGAGFTVLGIARAWGANTTYGWYWTADFGGNADPISNSPSISSFTASPSTVTSGQSATLSWNVTGANTVTISNGIGSVSQTGSRTVSPALTTTYILTATNNSGSMTAITTVSVTPAGDTSPPSVPTLTGAAVKSSTQVDLSWTASSDNVSVTGYQILRNGAVLTTVSGATLSYSNTGLTPSTTYSYAVRAFDAAANYSLASNSLQTTTSAAPVTALVCPSPVTGSFTGCYYGNTTLSGNPLFVRTDNQINFDWGAASPDPSLTPHAFSVRWAGYFNFSAGSYTFSATISDGMRVYLDGALFLNNWNDQPATKYTALQTVTQGTHLVTVEYYDHTGPATAHLTWQTTPPVAQLPSILSFTANPTAVTWGQPASLFWAVNGATSIAIDNGVGDVSNSLSTRVSLTRTTTYTLTASNSAGSKTAQVTVTVGSLGDSQPPTAPILLTAKASSSTQVDLTWSPSNDNVGVSGYRISRNGALLTSTNGTTLSYADPSAAASTTYTYTVLAYDAAGNTSSPSNSLTVSTPAGTPPPSGSGGGSCPAPAMDAFTGCYYNGVTLSGAPALTRTDNQINFDWGPASPGGQVTSGNFSVRWQGYFTFDSGLYAFTVAASDGIRVYIDGRLILDNWRDQPLFMQQARPTITQGTHLIAVEYYEHTGAATAHLTWRSF